MCLFFNDRFLASKVVGALHLRNELVKQSVGSDSLPNMVIIDGLRTRSILSLPANERGKHVGLLADISIIIISSIIL